MAQQCLFQRVMRAFSVRQVWMLLNSSESSLQHRGGGEHRHTVLHTLILTNAYIRRWHVHHVKVLISILLPW